MVVKGLLVVIHLGLTCLPEQTPSMTSIKFMCFHEQRIYFWSAGKEGIGQGNGACHFNSHSANGRN